MKVLIHHWIPGRTGKEPPWEHQTIVEEAPSLFELTRSWDVMLVEPLRARTLNEDYDYILFLDEKGRRFRQR
jgi:hypothetical protein